MRAAAIYSLIASTGLGLRLSRYLDLLMPPTAPNFGSNTNAKIQSTDVSWTRGSK